MKSGTKVLIVALIVMMLALAIAYASFSGVLKVSGKADASGKFEVVFTNGLVSTADHGTAKIDATDGTKMTANIKLGYPGDGCYVTATVKNNGTVPAKLTGFNLYNKGKAVRFQRLFLGFPVFCYNDYLWNPFFFVSIYTILLCFHFRK